MENSSNNRNTKPCVMVVTDRKALSLNRVGDVISFDDTGIILKTELGTLSIEGTDLHILRLSPESGEIEIEGKLCGFFYLSEDDGKKSGGRLRRIFG